MLGLTFTTKAPRAQLKGDMEVFFEDEEDWSMTELQATSSQAWQSRQAAAQKRVFPGKLAQIMEYPMEKFNQQPYTLQRALIGQKIVPVINVRP